MHDKELFFVIPTYRLRDVGDTIEHYDEHFWRNGHAVRMLVFDESSPANQEKYYPLLEQTRTHNDVYVLVNFRPVLTKRNWRMDCGVAGYDHTFGLPPFLSQSPALRGLYLPPVDSAGRRHLRPRRCGPDPYQEQ